MDEANVVEIICKDLINRKWNFWVDDHQIHKDLDYQKHSILISGARPDIYGFTNLKQIFAVEVKGLKDYKKAIGQALTYKTGVNLSYIGGITSKINQIKDVAIPSGLGLICVDENMENVEIVIDPIYTIYPFYLEDIKNELEVLSHHKNNERSFSSFGRTHILNYFSPLFLFKTNAIASKSALKEYLLNLDWKNKAYSELISGANIIGIIEKSENAYQLSNIGRFCLEYFESIGINTLSELQDTIDQSGRNKTVFSELPHLAKLLQLIYFQNPDFKKFISILQNFNKKDITFKEILDKLILEYPNLFINFYVKPTTRSKVIEIFLKGNQDVLMKDYNITISEYGHYNFFFAFKRHLVHLGVLSEENKTFYGKTEDYIINEDIWILSENILI